VLSTFSVAARGTIEYGEGTLRLLPGAVRALGGASVFVVTDPGIAACGILDQVVALLHADGLRVEVFADVEPNPCLATIDRAAALARAVSADIVVAVGGGSSLDAAKAISLAAAGARSARDLLGGVTGPGRPLVAIPTTAGTGAETNGFAVIEDSHAHCKVYIGHTSVLPRISILDPLLTVGLPPGPTAATGVDAFVHAIESLTARGRNPLSQAYAHHAVRLVNRWLPTAVSDGGDLQARGHMLLGSHLAGLALTISGLGLVHGIAHAVTSRTGTPHGLALASVLDRVLELNLPTSTAEYALIAVDLGVTSGSEQSSARATVDTARALTEQVGAYRPLGQHGVTADMVPGLAATALADPVTRNTPYVPSDDELRHLLLDAL